MAYDTIIMLAMLSFLRVYKRKSKNLHEFEPYLDAAWTRCVCLHALHPTCCFFSPAHAFLTSFPTGSAACSAPKTGTLTARA